jgi:hypothetical protein
MNARGLSSDEAFGYFVSETQAIAHAAGKTTIVRTQTLVVLTSVVCVCVCVCVCVVHGLPSSRCSRTSLSLAYRCGTKYGTTLEQRLIAPPL